MVVDQVVRKPLVIPAWCDPQARNYRLPWADTLIGVLIVDDERFVFVTPKAVVINASRRESALEWLRGKAFGMIPRFDLVTPHGTFRLYLSRPSSIASRRLPVSSVTQYGGLCTPGTQARLKSRGAPQLPGKPRAATLSATLSHESNEGDWNVGGPSTCLMS